MISEHAFREDLYFRLNVITLDLPPLRDREGDILTLAEFFLKRFCREHSRSIRGFSGQALEALKAYNWPGNVRELRNSVERAVLIEAEDQVEAEHLYLWRRRSRRQQDNGSEQREEKRQRIGYDFEIPDEGFSLDEFEKILIARAMKKARYNVSRAARMLGLSRETMRYRIKKHDLNLD
jgi:two-component system response regulator AtoC